MTIDKFIFDKPILDFFFRPSGPLKTLNYGNLEDGKFSSRGQYEFDESGRILSETGYQSGWKAYPVGFSPPPSIQYRRIYKYQDAQLVLVREEDINTQEQLEAYEFIYADQKLVQTIHAKDNGRVKFSTCYEYDEQGYLSIEKHYSVNSKNNKLYSSKEIERNSAHQVTQIKRIDYREREGEVVSREICSIREFEYEENRIRKILRNGEDRNLFSIVAELLSPDSDLIKLVKYPKDFSDSKQIAYQYDDYGNVEKIVSTYKDSVITQIYRFA